MLDSIAADVLVVIHFAFIAFVVLGGLAVLKWPRVAWAHLPCVAWGALIEFMGWVCPLTPLERSLRGEPDDAAGFIERYLLPIIYPAGMSRGVQLALGTLVLVVNFAVYAWLLRRRRSIRARRS